MPYSSSIQVVNDANGTAHAFLADNGNLWQCQWNAQAQRWDQGQVVPGAVGGEKLQALYLSDLWPAGSLGSGSAGSAPGIVLAYRLGEGASAEIVASFGRWGADGVLTWSQPKQLTNDQVDDQAFSLGKGNNGGFALVVQKQQAGPSSAAMLDTFAGTTQDKLASQVAAASSAQRPDSDLYVNQYSLSQTGTLTQPSWELTSSNPTATTPQPQITWAPAAAASAPSPVSFTGDTQLSRQALVPATGSTSPQAAASEPMVLMAAAAPTAPSAASGSSVSWNHSTAGQFSPKSGGALRFGLLGGEDPVRWKLRYPAVVVSSDNDGFERLVEDDSVVNAFGSGGLNQITQDATDLINPPGTRDATAVLQPAETIKKDATGGLFSTRYVTHSEDVANHSEWGLALQGTFGLTNLGQAAISPTAISQAKLVIDYGNDDKRRLITGASSDLSWNKGTSIGFGGALRTRYQYADKNPAHLSALTTVESIGIDLTHTRVRIMETGGTVTIKAAAGLGYSFEQTATPEEEGVYLPAWLGYIGYLGGLAADAEKKLLSTYFRRSINKSGGLASLVGGNEEASSYVGSLQTGKTLGDSLYDTRNGRNATVNKVNALLGGTLAALGPATALVAETSGKGLAGATFEHSSGEEIFARLTGRWLWKSLIGIQATVADKLDIYNFGAKKGTWDDSIFLNAAVAMPLGASIPLLAYTHTWSSDEPSGSGTDMAMAAPRAASSTAAPQVASNSAMPLRNGVYVAAPSGSDYPLLYTPAAASSSYFAPPPPTGANPYVLGSSKEGEKLEFFSLISYSGLINYTPPKGSTQPRVSNSAVAVTLYNAGSQLLPGSYTNVPLLGVTADGNKASGAFAAFTVNSSGNIVASSVQITTGGKYLHLPETEPQSGIYALIPDVFSTGIAQPPAKAGKSSAAEFKNDYKHLPLITISTAVPGSPLRTQAINRVQTVEVDPSGQNPAVVYPKYDPSTEQVTAPSANNNVPYTYTNIPVQLLATASGSSGATEVPLLNPTEVTATVHLSGGVIQRIDLDQSLLFVALAGTQNYSIQLGLPDAVLATLPANTSSSYDVQTEQAAFNNFADDDQFSAQVGLANAGVYIAAGVSDQIPLNPAMGRWPVQNRVTYVAAGNVPVYLNGLEKSATTNTWVAANEIEPSQLYPKSLYNDADIVFTAASSPTAVTIAGDKSDNYSGDTFVAWVEATSPVTPISTGNGAQDFQTFLNELYGDQRINFRIKTSNGWQVGSSLYQPETPSIISNLKAFQVAQPGGQPGEFSTLLVWTETSIAAIKGTVADIGSGDSVQSVIKAGFLNSAATSTSWYSLFGTKDANGNYVSTIQTIPWDPSTTDIGLTVSDISVGSLPAPQVDGSINGMPVISWSQDVRTPYRQHVLNDDPLLYLQFGELTSGNNAINIGTIQDPSTTGTQASSTGLNFAIPGALSKSQASAVLNTDGTGVLSTGLGSMYASIRKIVNNIPATVSSEIANFTGSIADQQLSVTAITAGSLAVGDLISGPGILPGTTITSITTGDGGIGSYAISQAQPVADTMTLTLQAIPTPSSVPLSSFSGAIEGTTLTINGQSTASLQLGDQVIGEGVLPGTFITAINAASYTVSKSQILAESALVAVPGAPTQPYTLEFWAQLLPDSNASGAGLVSFGQPSTAAVGDATLPSGWLLSSSFVVDRITYQQAAAQGLITAIPSGSQPSDPYGWAWGVVAEGANTTAMNGTGGSNLYSNSLQINNLVSGATLDGINQFLANYQLTSSDLNGVDGTNAATMAAVPVTQLQFDHSLDSSKQPISSLNTIAIDTNSALLNQGLMKVADLDNNPNGDKLTEMFEALWAFQEKTGEAKVSLSLAPDSINSTTVGAGQQPDPYTSEQYAGYELGFSQQSGVAVSVNGSGQLVFDFGKGNAITSELPSDLRDGHWHYIVASYLPIYQTYTFTGSGAPVPGELEGVDGTVAQVPTNVGTASLYVDNQLVGSQSNVINAYAPINLSDQALLLANNVGGAIDQFALYDKALTPAAFTPNASGQWPIPTTADALAMLASMGYNIDTKTPDPGAIPGAINSHWNARNVNPNAALLGTYTSSYDVRTGTWTNATSLNPLLQAVSTVPSYSSGGSIQDGLVIAVPTANWTKSDWNETTSAGANTDGFFNPANQELTGVTVNLTNSTDRSQAPVTISLTPDQVLIGSQSLQSLQPLASDADFNYTVLSNTPAFSLLIPKDQLPADKADRLKDQYSATYSFSFGEAPNSVTTVGTTAVVDVNSSASSLAAMQATGVVSSSTLSSLQDNNKAIATAAVIEQAPLQLKYVDSGVVLKSAETAAGASNPAEFTPANSFGQSQVFGSFTDTNNNTNGWLAVAQPFTTNALSDPAGRVWIQYTGQSSSGTPSSDVATAPTTWLNALANSNFSPESPNLPLLGDANNPNRSSGGLLIKADPTAGWGQNFGKTMLVADVNKDGTSDLIIAAPQANGCGRVVIVDGTWISSALTSSGGATTLDLSNPSSVGSYVTVLTPAVPTSSDDHIDVANFGSALAFDGTTLWIGAPNYLKQAVSGSKALQTLLPIGAVYSYTKSEGGWDSATTTDLSNPILGSWGTTLTSSPGGTTTTSYWGSEFGTAIAVNGSSIAVSAPGVQASLLYSGTQAVQQSIDGKKNPSEPYGDGALIKIQLPSNSNNNSVSSVDGVNNSGLVAIGQSGDLSSEDSTYMQNLKALQVDNIAQATYANNQAIQAGPVGAVYLFNNSGDFAALASPVTAQGAYNASHGGATFYGALPWNTLGASGFGASLSFGDYNNTNSKSILAIGAPQAGGSGAVYMVDTNLNFASTASHPRASWLKDRLGDNQYLVHVVSGVTLYGAESGDNFGNGLVNLGDVNGDSYNDLMIQAFNASSGAGNAYVLFGNDQLNPDASSTPNPFTGSVASGSIGLLKRADGSSLTTPILSELGSGARGYTGQGSFGGGDLNGDGLNDIPLGSGPNANAYITWGHPYLEAIDNLQLSKLNSDSGFMLDGLASVNQGSLRSIGDFNGDGYGDFMSVSPGNALTTVRIELGANTQEILADAPYSYYTFTVANGTQVLPGGDVNGDGMDDIVLFLDQNLSSADDGNGGAGSTTGILYGRSSIDLPLGAGFGFIAPVDPSSSAPLAPLPGLPVEQSAGEVGLTDATASVIAVGNTLYAAVKGYGDNTLWFTQSQDGGNSWDNWTELGTVNGGFATSSGPSLAFFENKLYLGFLNLSGTLSLSSWDSASNNLAAWSAPTALSDSSDPTAAFSSTYGPQVLDRGDVLGMVWVDAHSGTLQTSSSPTPDGAAGGWTSPTSVLQRLENKGVASFVPISATAAPTATWLGGVPVLAVNDNGSINVYAGAQSGSSLELTSSFSAPSGGPAITSAPVLTSTPTGLALTYTNADGSISLNRLSFITDSGTPLPGVEFNADGSINTSNADLQWQSTTLNASNSGLSTSLASTPVSVNGNLLLTNVRNSTSQDNQIWINAVPDLSDAASTTWLNSSVQLPNGSGGWSFQQRSGTVNIGTFMPDWNGDAGGLSPSAPSFAELNGVLYAAVVGYNSGSANGQLYWNSSPDGGRTWGGWAAVPNYASYQAPALAAYQGSLYMAYVGTNKGVYIAQLSDPGSNTWSQVQAGSQTCQYIGLTSENGVLAAYYVGTNNELYRTATTTPSSGSDWSNSMVIQYSGGNQTASGNLAVTTIPGSGSNSDTTYIAYQGGTPSSPNDTLYLTYSSSQSNGSSSSWAEGSISVQPSTANRGGVTLAHNRSGLLLGYPDKVNGEVAYVVKQSTNSGSSWTPFTTLAAPSGTTLPSSGGTSSFSLLASPNSNDVLVGAIQNGTGDNDAIYTAIVSELPPSTSLSSSQTQSNLSAVGDLNGDGFDDLLVAANNVVVNPSGSSPTLATGLRLISGAATSDQILAANTNNTSSSSQNVQLAPWRGLNNTTPVASLSGNGQLSVTTTDSVSGLSLSSSAAVSASTAFTATAGDLATAQKLFKPGAGVTVGKPPAGPRLGDLGLISAGGFGDLDGDGFVDHLDPTSVTVLTGAYNQTWNLWSIRAAGDVNGNGVDDVLLSLAPQGPAYTEVTSGQPSALQSVLVDGYLFKVDSSTNSFRLDQLKSPLNPYNSSQLYDVGSTSTSDYAPSLQNWFEPILGFEPGSLSSASVGQAVTPGSADTYTPPCPVVSPEGKTYLFFSGADTGGTNGASGLWMAYVDSLGTWQQASLSNSSSCNESTPSAAYFNGQLYVAYADVNQEIHVAVCSGAPEVSANWRDYTVCTSVNETTVNEATAFSPTLIAEAGRLALYFPSNNSGNSTIQTVRYLYSNDPSESTSWGGSFNASKGMYSGISQQLEVNGASQQVTSPIAATTFHGRTVLAYRGYNSSFNNGISNGTVQIVTLGYTEKDGSIPRVTRGWTITDTGKSNLNGVGLATDQALLYLTTSGSYGVYDPSSTVWSLSPGLSADTWSAPARADLSASPSLANHDDYGVINPFFLNGRMMAAWTSYGYEVQISDLDLTVGAPAQQSLAGYSLDGNIDVNGDGFKDVLISDPSDPSESVDNQYALFGGDYLNIASQVGTPGDDELVGTPLADVIYSLGGSDGLSSGGGNDVIYTGSGDDQISIADNKFIRIDAGSGFDTLQLQGLVNQAYDFQLNVDKPQYFVGTKLRDIELISSIDYGANALSFDVAAVNAINPDRILFLTPDASDTIYLSTDFQAAPASYNTTFGGYLWNAYIAGLQASSDDSSPTLVYVLNPTGASSSDWLASHVSIDSTNAPTPTNAPALLGAESAPAAGSRVADPAPTEADPITVPQPSAIAGSMVFGEGLTLVAYRSDPSSGLARFAIERSDSRRRQVVAYASNSANSTAEPGRDYTAIAGLLVLEPGELFQELTVPIDSTAFKALRGGSLSLKVEELPDLNQSALHLLLAPAVSESATAAPPVLSGFELTPNASGDGASLRLRADANGSNSDLASLQLAIRQRSSASGTDVVASQAVSLLDAIAVSGAPVPAYDRVAGALALDHDGLPNGQISGQLELNFTASDGQPSVSLSAPTLRWQPSLQLAEDLALEFLDDVPLTCWRADSGSGVVSFALEGDGSTYTLLRDARGGTAGSIDPGTALDDSASGWLSTEGKAVGSRSVIEGLELAGTSWRPTASRDGQALELLDVHLDGNQITAEFEGGVTTVFGQQGTGRAPAAAPISPSVQVQRLGCYDNALGFYALDAVTGEVDGLAPGDPGYLKAALARSKASGLLLQPDQMPAFGSESSYDDLPLNSNYNYGLLLLVDGDRNRIVSSFAEANPGGVAQMINLGSTANGLVLGFEDQSALPGRGDSDFNDVIVTIQHVTVPLF